MITEVIFAEPPYGPFDYDASLCGPCVPGTRVEVPFGRARRRGYVSAVKEKSALSALKKISKVIDDKPVLCPAHLELASALAKRFVSSAGVFADLLYPLNLKVTLPLAEIGLRPSESKTPSAARLSAVRAGFGERFEIYRGILSDDLGGGRSVVMVMPTARDAVWAAEFFREFSPILWNPAPSSAAAVYGDITEGAARFVIGARRAVFLLPPKLSKIIVERDYDYGHKDGRRPYYATRDAALAFAALLKGVEAVFGGLVFSTTAYKEIISGAIRVLPEKEPEAWRSPPFEIERPADFARPGAVSSRLKEYFDGAYFRRRPVVLHTARKSGSSGYYCGKCSRVIKCTECDVALASAPAGETQRKSMSADTPGIFVFKCPYCSKTFGVAAQCPVCGSPDIRPLAAGAVKIAAEIKRMYPDAQVAAVSSNEKKIPPSADFVVTTSPVPPYALAGPPGAVIVTDAGIDTAHPEFDAAEKSFLRAAEYLDFAPEGRVIVFPAARLPGAADIFGAGFREFYDAELSSRKTLGYPPYGRLVELTFRGSDEKKTLECASAAAENLARAASGCAILGPSAGRRSKLKGVYIYKVMLKCPEIPDAALEYLRDLKPAFSGVRASVDANHL